MCKWMNASFLRGLILMYFVCIAMLWSYALHFPFFTKLFQTPCTSRHVSEWTTIQLQYLEEVITPIADWNTMAPRVIGSHRSAIHRSGKHEDTTPMHSWANQHSCRLAPKPFSDKISDLNLYSVPVLQNGSREMLLWRHGFYQKNPWAVIISFLRRIRD